MKSPPDQLVKIALQTGKTVDTIRRWIVQGCDITSPESVHSFLVGKDGEAARRAPYAK